MNKKILIILIVVVVLGISELLALTVFKSGKNISTADAECFKIDSEKNEITDYKEICGNELKIPEDIKGVKIKKIGNIAFSKKGLTTVILPKGIEEIGISAFSDNEIEILDIPETVKTIKPLAFENNKIKKLKIPESVLNIGFKAFNNNQVSGDDAFIYQRTESGIDNTMLIGYAGKKRENIKVPEEVDYLYLYAFADCNIKSIKLNDKLERIETGAFENNNLTSIEIPQNVIVVNRNAFAGNKGLKEIKVKGKKSLSDFSMFNTEELNTSIITFE